MGNRTKEDELYREMCRVVGKVVLEMRDLGQEPKHIVIAGVLRTALANKRIQPVSWKSRRWKPSLTHW
ncbi:fumarate hydratase FumD [Escherichia coli]